MTNETDGTKLAPHGLFYMENAGGYPIEETPSITPLMPIAPSKVPNGHQPSCFALEEERGEDWKGTGASGPLIKETKPSL